MEPQRPLIVISQQLTMPQAMLAGAVQVLLPTLLLNPDNGD